MEFLNYCRNRGTPASSSPEASAPKPKPKLKPRLKPKEEPKEDPVTDPEVDDEVEVETKAKVQPKPKKGRGRPFGAKTDRSKVGKIERELMQEDVEREVVSKLKAAQKEGKLEKEANRMRTRLKLIRSTIDKKKTINDNVQSDHEELAESGS